MDVLKRYDLRWKFNLGSSFGKPVCCIARISMTVIRMGLFMTHESLEMFCKDRTLCVFFFFQNHLFQRRSWLDDPGFDMYLYSKTSRPALELTQPYVSKVLTIKTNKMHYFSTVFGKELYLFQTDLLSIFRSLHSNWDLSC